MDPPAQTTAPNLVGRNAEIDLCHSALDDLEAGRGATLLFCGEPGIGKSSLARLAASLAADRSIPAYWGFSWESGGAPAYWPWTQALSSLVRDHDVPDELLEPLAQVLSDVTAAANAPQLQPDQARFRLLEAARAMLATLAAKNPFMLILEDLHAADSETLHLLRHLARHAATMPVLLIGTYREIEARVSTNSQPLWQTARDANVIKLRRLDESDIRAFLEQHRDASPECAEVHQLLEITAGNPLFLNELTDLLAHSATAEDMRRHLPDTVQQVIRQQVGLLPAATCRLLSIASVLGRSFSVESLAFLATDSEQAITTGLAQAIAAGIIDDAGILDFEFSHALYRDVLYNDMDAGERSLLHDRYANRLEELIEAGNTNLHSLLATHLLRGSPGRHLRAVGALRQAADIATKRLAFDEASGLLGQALAAFGEGPRSDPVARCRLIIEYANALAYKGDIAEGQSCCEQAFAIARTVRDPRLMADVALTWGRAIVVARVDRKLIAALEECLDALPNDEVALRALLLARLAGALQPAPDPTGPMEMAREAIALARSAGDAEIVFQVLRFAIAALMDFAPVEERMPLNREFLELASQHGDVPSQFRSYLRLTIDASEAGERAMLDEVIDACGELADRIGLPHYRWRAASIRAMRATIEGDFARAAALLDDAESLATEAEDVQASVTLAIQRFALLIDWDSPHVTPLEDIKSRLQIAYGGGFKEAEFYVTPLIGIYSNIGDRNFARRFIGNNELVARTFAGADRYSVASLGVIALLADNEDVARRAYDTLLQYQDYCATLGLMGSCWCGPIHHWLGRIAHGLGDHETAESHFDEALRIAERMRARPELARIHASAALLGDDLGDAAKARSHRQVFERLRAELELRAERSVPARDAALPAAQPAQGRRISMVASGDHWSVTFDGDTAAIRNTKGLGMLARLLERPESDIHVLDLADAGSAATNDSGPMLDPQAREEYGRRVGEINEELEDAETMADIGRAESLREELDFITRELSRAFGLGGRERTAGSAAERARVNVRRRIKDAIRRIDKHLPGAGRYLESTIKTGTYCRYKPF